METMGRRQQRSRRSFSKEFKVEVVGLVHLATWMPGTAVGAVPESDLNPVLTDLHPGASRTA